MADETEADDGALHALFDTHTLEAVRAMMLALLRLASWRGPVPPDVRARAQALADDPTFPLGHHPILRRILEAPDVPV